MYKCLLCPKLNRKFESVYKPSVKRHFKWEHNKLYPKHDLDYLDRSKEFATKTKNLIDLCFREQDCHFPQKAGSEQMAKNITKKLRTVQSKSVIVLHRMECLKYGKMVPIRSMHHHCTMHVRKTNL